MLKWLLQDAAWTLSGNVAVSPSVFARRPTPPRWIQGHTILLDLGWFSFLPQDLMTPSIQAGQPIFKISAPTPETRNVQPASLDETRHGISLRSLCEYELCVTFDCMPHELDAFADDTRLHRAIAKSRELLDWAFAVLDYFAPARVAYPQGYVLPAAALRLAAQQRGLDVIALENTFRKDRICWDDQTGITLATPVPMQMFAVRKDNHDPTYFQRYQQEVNSLKSAEHSTAGSADLPRVQGRKILFIGQVNSDSSVLFHLAPGFSSQMDAVTCTANFVAEASATVMVLKVHPKEVHGLNPLGQPYSVKRYQDFKELHKTDGDMRIVTDDTASMDTMKAIAWADICVTVNSQAGLEAAAMGKPVILCGASHYDQLKSVTVVKDKDELHAALSVHSPKTDMGEAQSFFQFYCDDYACPATVQSLLALLARSGTPAKPHPLLKLALKFRNFKRTLRSS